jgi:hypothetical protein
MCVGQARPTCQSEIVRALEAQWVSILRGYSIQRVRCGDQSDRYQAAGINGRRNRAVPVVRKIFEVHKQNMLGGGNILTNT